jgi:WD40 repeat protein
VQIGDHGTQINYYYKGTWTDGVAPRPLVGMSGTIISPYRGLNAFGERDAGLFFGRETAVAEVLERMSRLDGPGLLVVSGVSGAGKSSLIGAGVLPRLRGTGLWYAPEASTWPCLVFTPSRAPLRELAIRVAPLARVDAADMWERLTTDPAGFALTAQAATQAQPDAWALSSNGHDGAAQRRLLIVVDQCEQLFTRCETERERQAFITALHAAATGAHDDRQSPGAMVVLVVRADFEARLADFEDRPELTTAVKDRYLLTAMTELQLQMAITQPAVAAGSSVDRDLVEVLLNDVRRRASSAGPTGTAAGGAGVLPLLSHALDEAWRHRAGSALTLTDYEQSGGIDGAVATSAERAYNRLSASQRDVARHVFISLTTVGGDGTDTAARAVRSDLTAGRDESQARDIETVLETFTAERLLTMAADTVEISHEALLTAWPLLRDTWLAETRTDRAIRARLHATAEEWANASRDPSYLYDGSRLEAARETADRIDSDARHASISRVERDFLTASGQAHNRRRRRQQGLIGLLVALVVGFASIAIVATHLGQDANHESAAAFSGQVGAQSELEGDADPAVAKMQSIAAWRLDQSPQAWYAMMNAATLPGITSLPGDSAAFSPDGKILAIGDSGTVRLWDVATMKPLGANIPAGGKFLFSPDGKTIVIAGSNGTVRLWSIAARKWTGQPFARGGVPVAFSSNGANLAVILDQGSYIQIWNVDSRTAISGAIARGGRFRYDTAGVAYSPNGALLATQGYSNASIVTFWNVKTGKRADGAITSPCLTGAQQSLAFSPNGTTLATGCGGSGVNYGTGNGAVALFDVATHKQIGGTITSVDAPVGQVAFSPDGKLLAVASTGSNGLGGFGGGAFLFDVATHQQVSQPLTGGGPVFGVAFSPDGKILASETGYGGIQLWDVARATGEPGGGPITIAGGIGGLALSPDHDSLAVGVGNYVYGGSGNTVRLYNAGDPTRISRSISIPGGAVGAMAFSPDGNTLAVASSSLTSFCETARLFTVATGLETGRFTICADGSPPNLAFSPSGKILAFSGGSETQLWDVADHKTIGSPLPFSLVINSLAFSPDGTMLAVGGGENASGGIIDLWNVATHKRIRSITFTLQPFSSVAFDPDDSDKLATASYDGAIRLWDVRTGKITQIFTSSADEFGSVSFSPNGKTLAATGSTGGVTSANGALYLFDLKTSQQIGSPITLTSPPSAVAFSSDGKTLVTADVGTTGVLQFWDVSFLLDPERSLCSEDGALFTRTEWASLQLPIPYENVCP